MDAARLDRERRKAGIAEIANVGAKRAQRVDQIADRPLVHARNSRQLVMPAGKRKHGGERPERRAGVAQMQARRP